MKILFLSSYGYPEQAASSYLGGNRNQAFADAGFKMVTYVPTPTRGVTPEIRKKYKKIKYEMNRLISRIRKVPFSRLILPLNITSNVKMPRLFSSVIVRLLSNWNNPSS